MRHRYPGRLLVVDAGDFLYRSLPDAQPLTPEVKNTLTRIAEVVVASYGVMRFDAVGIGPDDLILGPATMGSLVSEANLPVLSANLLAGDGRLFAKPYVIREVDGVTWGIFSLISARAPDRVRKGNSTGWAVLDPLKAGQDIVSQLRARTDAVVLLAGMPFTELKVLLSKLKGISVVVVAQSRRPFRVPVELGDTIAVRSHGGRYIGELELVVEDPAVPFVSEQAIERVQRQLAAVSRQLAEGKNGNLKRSKEQLLAALAGMHQKNLCRNKITQLSAQYKENQEVAALVKTLYRRRNDSVSGCGR
jgi:2',3'-cyclic-nucleotide 2'-phosphodiesterase (5'-nucleotidase family)